MVYIILGILFLFLVIYFIIAFNKFVQLQNLVKEAWSLIEVQLKMRYELIPNLVNTVKAYMEHEHQILREVTALRAEAMHSSSPQKVIKTENILSDKLAQLMITIENYPELKADEHFLKLQHQVFEVENKIQLARRYYNGAVRNYNIAIESFPSNIIAALLNYNPIQFFELDSIEERKNVEISFNK